MNGLDRFIEGMVEKGYTIEKVELPYSQYHYHITHENGVDTNMTLDNLPSDLGEIIWNELCSVDEAMKLLITGMDEFLKIFNNER